MLELAPCGIYRAQYRATYKFDDHDSPEKRRHVAFSFILIYVLPPVVAFISFCVYAFIIFLDKSDIRQQNLLSIDDSLLASLAILSAALITAFSLLASWRNSVSEQFQGAHDHARKRWLLDTASAHLLAGAYSSVIASIVVILTKALNLLNNSIIEAIGNVIAIGISTHVVMSLLIALPSLYSAYVQLNDVDSFLNGQNDKDIQSGASSKEETD